MEVNRKIIFLVWPVSLNALSKAREMAVAFMTTGSSLIYYFSLFGDCWELKMRNRLER